MTRKQVVGVFGLFLLFPLVTSAQSASTRRDPEAVALLSRSLRVITNGVPIHDATLTGTARRIAGSDDETGEVTAKALATGESRVDYSYASGERSESRRMSPTGVVESWSGPDRSVHAVVPHNAAPLSPWFFPGALLQTLEQRADTALEYVGKETRGGRTVEHVTIASQVPAYHHPRVMLTLLQKSARVELYLDVATGFPVAIAYNTHPDKNLAQDIPVEIRFSDYRPVEGVQVPYQIQKYLNHARVLDLKVSTTILNSGLSATSLSLQ
jgi:hypothetical protein